MPTYAEVAPPGHHSRTRGPRFSLVPPFHASGHIKQRGKHCSGPAISLPSHMGRIWTLGSMEEWPISLPSLSLWVSTAVLFV